MFFLLASESEPDDEHEVAAFEADIDEEDVAEEAGTMDFDNFFSLGRNPSGISGALELDTPRFSSTDALELGSMKEKLVNEAVFLLLFSCSVFAIVFNRLRGFFSLSFGSDSTSESAGFSISNR